MVRRPERAFLLGLLLAVAIHGGVALAVLRAWQALGWVAVALLALLGGLLAGHRLSVDEANPRRRRLRPLAAVGGLLASLVAHGALLAALALLSFGQRPPPRPSLDLDEIVLPFVPDDPSGDDRPVELQALVEDLRRPTVRMADPNEEQRRREEESTKPAGQVVDIARPTLEQRPDEAEFLAEYDSKVDRQTKGPAGRDKAGGREALPPSSRAERERAPVGVPFARPGRVGALAMVEPRPTAGGDGDLVEDRARRESEPGEDGVRAPVPGTPGARGRPRVAPGEGGFPGTPGASDLQPTEEMLARAIGHGAGSLDYLRDIEEGESTALNAKKWKYASFFNRVKRAVADQWHPDVVFLRHDPTGNVYGSRDRVTVLRAQLDGSGKLVDLQLVQSCQVGFLDDEAMDSFRRAQPFPNPPPQLAEADGMIRFNFGFIFEMSGKTNFRLFRYQ